MYLQVKSNKIRDSFIYINHLTHCCKFSIKYFITYRLLGRGQGWQIHGPLHAKN